MSWKSYKLGDILTRKRIKVDIQPDISYKLVTIKLYHKGVVLRQEKKGEDIKSNMHRVNKGDFILSGIDARNGAFGIVPEELDNAIVTNDFWVLEPKKDILRKDFFLFITSTSFFDYICNQCSDGTTQRIRLQRDKFYDYELSLPPFEEQEGLVKQLTVNDSTSDKVSSELINQLNLVKQLRQSFLREAMQGKLVEQNPNDEPAAVLLSKIKAEKEQLIKEKKIKKQKLLPPISEEEIPFQIPENWEWCRLKEMVFITGGGTPSKGKNEYWNGDIPWVSPKDMKSLEISDTELKVTQIGVSNSSAKLIPKGSLLVVGRSGILKRKLPVAINIVNCVVNQDMKVLIPFFLNTNRFIQYLLRGLESIILKDYVKFGMTVHSLKYTEFEFMPIPLPPLSEQKRIVAKLDELMAYCDNLELSIKNSQTQNQQLLQQVLREALEPKTELKADLV
eukprot:TRINITY_DN6168_c0_g2_i1.p1 TRINITY_DN6168_c0_g2~~TRINITY_DN6168_c0_g2_i1.p1  ORF type:complete len:449 (+),score=73.03 TRINITY_DN6168_c0_g2_i1:837-2183(+)